MAKTSPNTLSNQERETNDEQFRFDESSFVQILRGKWGSFTPIEQSLKWLLDEKNFENPRLVGVVKNLPKSGEESSLNYPLVVVFAKLKDGKELGERSSRKQQFELAKRVLNEFATRPPIEGVSGFFSNGLFVFFDDNENFRLSLVTGTVDPKSYKMVWNSFKRQSFFVEAGGTNRTFKKRFLGDLPAGTLKDLQEIFSVEKLTKEFYAEIENWFLYAKKHVKFPGAKVLKATSNEEHNSMMTLRLITRLIFIWFLKQKKLVPADLFEKNKINELLKFDVDLTGSTYYRAILQNLFFATLNTPLNARAWVERQTGSQEFFRYKRFFKNDKKFEYLFNICGRVPFVNGGLFENLDVRVNKNEILRVDCFSNNKGNWDQLVVPDELFLSENTIKPDKDKKGVSAETRGLIPILKQYDFTVSENAPADEDVSLDPELLGRVFENLLAYVTPETQEQARKASGSFYTPREIVNYMVDESLIAYLTENLGEKHAPEIRKIIAGTVSETKLADKIEAALYAVKVLDPACGSGAFPMGMLSKIIDILETVGKLDPSDSDAVYKAKLSIIQNCIYGVDIQNIAVQISKLRFFISLLCEQKANDNKKDNFGISVLPNLETKIVAANTLISLPKAIDAQGSQDGATELAIGDNLRQCELSLGNIPEILTLRERLKECRKNYFKASAKAEKQQLRKDDKEIRRKLSENLLSSSGANNVEFEKSVKLITEWNPYDPNSSSSFFDPEWMFGLDSQNPFDIVIGNPPYGAKLSEDDVRLFKRDYRIRTTETAILFLERAIGFGQISGFLSNNAILAYIIPKSYSFSSNYSDCRNYTRAGLAELVDCGKAFEKVKFEANIVRIYKNKNLSVYKSSFFANKQFSYVATIEKDSAREFGFFLNGISLEELKLGRKIKQDKSFLTPDIARNSRGGIFQKYILDIGDFFVLGGKEIQRNCIVNTKGKVAKEVVKGDLKSEIKDNSVLVQRIVAHIKNPFPQIKITAFPTNKLVNFRIVDTINQIVVSNDYSNKFISAILNSRLINWYAYLFIFGKAIRTMQFDNVITDRIPVPAVSVSKQEAIISLVEKILEMKRVDVSADTSELELKIDTLVYELYGLTPEEIAIVEGSCGDESSSPDVLESDKGKSIAPRKSKSSRPVVHPGYDPSLDD